MKNYLISCLIDLSFSSVFSICHKQNHLANSHATISNDKVNQYNQYGSTVYTHMKRCINMYYE